MIAEETHLRYIDGIERNDLGLKEKIMRARDDRRSFVAAKNFVEGNMKNKGPFHLFILILKISFIS